MPNPRDSIPLRGLIERDGLFRVAGDFDVLDAFRVKKRAVDELFRPRRDHQRLWQLYVLSTFLGVESGAAPVASAGAT